jgi:hypothetical protein
VRFQRVKKERETSGLTRYKWEKDSVDVSVDDITTKWSIYEEIGMGRKSRRFTQSLRETKGKVRGFTQTDTCAGNEGGIKG